MRAGCGRRCRRELEGSLRRVGVERIDLYQMHWPRRGRHAARGVLADAAPGVTGAIVGARNADQVDGWIAAGSLELDASDVEAIGDAIEKTRAGSGPSRPAR